MSASRLHAKTILSPARRTALAKCLQAAMHRLSLPEQAEGVGKAAPPLVLPPSFLAAGRYAAAWAASGLPEVLLPATSVPLPLDIQASVGSRLHSTLQARPVCPL